MKAVATGRVLHDPKRFQNRREPKVDNPLGPPPKWMKNPSAVLAWQELALELPWLNQSHRALVGIAAEMRGRIMAGDELSIAGYNLLRLCLSQMGATPVDSSKVNVPGDEEPDDPTSKYF